MKKYLLATAAAAMLATPSLADGTKMISVNLSGVPHKAGNGTTSIISVGTVDLIAFSNRVDVYDPATNSKIAALTVSVPLAVITDMVFVAPSFLTLQGGGAFAVTVDYSTVPPTILPPVGL